VFTALLDTCILWPSLQRDFLLSLAVEGMYRPIWSSAILDELEYQEAQKLERRGSGAADAASRAAYLVGEMRRAFDDAEVIGWEPLAGSYGLRDADDEHVVAAAVVGNAGAIVTLNTKDFPAALIPNGIAVIKPAEFAMNTVCLDPSTALRAVNEIAARTGTEGPKRTVEELLDHLVRLYGMDQAVDEIRAVVR
jgi:predicted nucleic acid-binding protein